MFIPITSPFSKLFIEILMTSLSNFILSWTSLSALTFDDVFIIYKLQSSELVSYFYKIGLTTSWVKDFVYFTSIFLDLDFFI